LRPQRVSHDIRRDPLFSQESLQTIAASLGDVGHWKGRVPPDEEVHIVKQRYTPETSLQDSIARIDEVDVCVCMTHAQRNEDVATVVHRHLDEWQSLIEKQDPGMSGRAGWIFVTSPGGTCPYHRDHTANLFLQIDGPKRVYVWDANDPLVCSEPETEILHGEISQRATNWSAELFDKAQVFDLEPGDGVYIPFGAPHMVEISDRSSISLSLIYGTRATRRAVKLYRANRMLRRLGMSPRPPRTIWGATGADDVTRLTEKFKHDLVANIATGARSLRRKFRRSVSRR
jgi:hypothetical protein